jgi:hypothetical protein
MLLEIISVNFCLQSWWLGLGLIAWLLIHVVYDRRLYWLLIYTTLDIIFRLVGGQYMIDLLNRVLIPLLIWEYWLAFIQRNLVGLRLLPKYLHFWLLNLIGWDERFRLYFLAKLTILFFEVVILHQVWKTVFFLRNFLLYLNILIILMWWFYFTVRLKFTIKALNLWSTLVHFLMINIWLWMLRKRWIKEVRLLVLLNIFFFLIVFTWLPALVRHLIILQGRLLLEVDIIRVLTLRTYVQEGIWLL